MRRWQRWKSWSWSRRSMRMAGKRRPHEEELPLPLPNGHTWTCVENVWRISRPKWSTITPTVSDLWRSETGDWWVEEAVESTPSLPDNGDAETVTNQRDLTRRETSTGETKPKKNLTPSWTLWLGSSSSQRGAAPFVHRLLECYQEILHNTY